MGDLISSVPCVFTIGHSNHPSDHFIHLLKANAIEVLVDSRSRPYSKYARQFDHESLQNILRSAGVRHIYLGRELGGRPDGDEFYDREGHVLYDRIAATPQFQVGLARLQRGISDYKVAVLCAEENPTGCHRRLLIARMLIERGIKVEHIRGDGRIQPEEELAAELDSGAGQLPLFQKAAGDSWRSVLPLSRKKAALV